MSGDKFLSTNAFMRKHVWTQARTQDTSVTCFQLLMYTITRYPSNTLWTSFSMSWKETPCKQIVISSRKFISQTQTCVNYLMHQFLWKVNRTSESPTVFCGPTSKELVVSSLIPFNLVPAFSKLYFHVIKDLLWPT